MPCTYLKKKTARNRQLPVILSSNWFFMSSARGVVVSVVDFKHWGWWFKTDSVKKKKNCSFQKCVSFTELGAFVLLLCFHTNMCFLLQFFSGIYNIRVAGYSNFEMSSFFLQHHNTHFSSKVLSEFHQFKVGSMFFLAC
jgi:hypothetical protein